MICVAPPTAAVAAKIIITAVGVQTWAWFW
jgi:hypothetical protein